jgi:hypothetical protein
MIGDKGKSHLQRNKRSGDDRRAGPERRQERRGDDERRKTERRRLKYGVLFKTVRSIELIDDWLEKYCQGDWHIVLDDLEDDLTTKRLRIMFELEDDKNLFSSKF